MKKAVLIVGAVIVAAVGLTLWFSPNFRARLPDNLKKTREVWFTPWRTSGLDAFYIKTKTAQVRNQPFNNSLVTIELLQNTEVRLEELEGDWARIVVNDGTRGWVRTSSLSRRPVEAHATQQAVPSPQQPAAAKKPSPGGQPSEPGTEPPKSAGRQEMPETPRAETPVEPPPSVAEPVAAQPVEPPPPPTVPAARTGQTGPLDIPPAVQRTVPVVTPAAPAPTTSAQPVRSTAPVVAPKPVVEKPIVAPKPVVEQKPPEPAKQQPAVSTPTVQQPTQQPPAKKPAPVVQQPAPPKEIICPRCGTKNVEGDRFCIYCREPLR